MDRNEYRMTEGAQLRDFFFFRLLFLLRYLTAVKLAMDAVSTPAGREYERQYLNIIFSSAKDMSVCLYACLYVCLLEK